MAGINERIKKWFFPPEVQSAHAAILSLLKCRPKGLSAKDCKLLQQNSLLKDIHCNRRCFILGAGPSIKQQNISRLSGEYVISVSNTFVHPDFKIISPRYHILPPILESHGNLQSVEKYVDWLRQMEGATGEAEMFLHIGDRSMVEQYGLFNSRKIHWLSYKNSWDKNFQTQIDLQALPPIWSVSEAAISVAIYLGFKEIYLLGIDHDWFNGLFNHFYEYKQEDIDHWKTKLTQVDSEFQMRRHAEIFHKYKYLYSLKKNIFNANANKNTYVDVFPKVDFDSLFIKV